MYLRKIHPPHDPLFADAIVAANKSMELLDQTVTLLLKLLLYP